MNKIDQFLYDNYIYWKTGVLVFMWQIKIVTSRKLSVETRQLFDTGLRTLRIQHGSLRF